MIGFVVFLTVVSVLMLAVWVERRARVRRKAELEEGDR